MTKIQEHYEKILETRRQIELTRSPMRKRDLQRHLKRLEHELKICQKLRKA